MREKKHNRMEEVLHRAAAEFVRDNATKASLLTVTRVELTDNGKSAQIYFTTIPTEQEETALKFLERKLPEFKEYLRDKTSIGFLPFLNWRIDLGERNRQRLDEIKLD